MHITEIAFPPKTRLHWDRHTNSYTHCIAHFPPVNQYNRYNLIPSWRLLPIAIALKRWYGKIYFYNHFTKRRYKLRLYLCSYCLVHTNYRGWRNGIVKVLKARFVAAPSWSPLKSPPKGGNFKRKQKQIRLYRFRSFINYRTINVMNLENLEKKKRWSTSSGPRSVWSPPKNHIEIQSTNNLL